MDLGLKGKTVAVMAASQGLGRAAAEVFAREGADVVICGRRGDQVETAVNDIHKAHKGSRVEGMVADVSKAADVQRFIQEAANLGGGHLDALVCNSGGPPSKLFEELGDADWQAAFELLVLSNVRAIRAALPFLKKRGGAVVNITSVSVKQPIAGLILSNSLRMAVVGIAKTLSQELAPHNIRVNSVCPGFISTDRAMDLIRTSGKRQGMDFEAAKRAREQDIPMGRIGEPMELAEVIAFLASPRASYITGTTLGVDGGSVRYAYG